MNTPLLRSLGLGQITLYGLGTIIGAGIYVLIGEVAASSGSLLPLAFVVAAVVVSFSAYSYGHLASRFPLSAGEAMYVHEAFRSRILSMIVGYTLVFAGMVSAATITKGFTGYFAVLMQLPDPLTITLVVIGLVGIAAWGIRQSVAVAIATTALELVGLALVIYAGAARMPTLLQHPTDYFAPLDAAAWQAVGAGAFIAFYAFIGFEDMVNIAEEVREPERNMPRGIFLALLCSCSLYLIVALAALAAASPQELASSRAPLVMVIERNTSVPPQVMSAISMVALINGALLQIIMAARVLYGMGSRAMAPSILARVSPRTRTPVLATALVGGGVYIAALAAPLVSLAQATSSAILCIFTLVNLSLLRLNWRDCRRGPAALGIPAAGALICASFLASQFWL